MRNSVKIISIILIIAMVFSLSVSASALDVSTGDVSWDFASKWDFLIHNFKFTNLFPFILGNDSVGCVLSPDFYHHFDLHGFGSDDYHILHCKYCGTSVTVTPNMIKNAYNDYVSSIDNPIISNGDLGISLPLYLAPETLSIWNSMLENGKLLSFSHNPNSVEFTLGAYSRSYLRKYYWFPGVSSVSGSLYHYFCTDEFFIGDSGTFDIHFPYFTASNFYIKWSFSNLYLQRLVDGTWENFYSINESNGSDLSSRSIEGGYTYRFYYSLYPYSIDISASASSASSYYTGLSDCWSFNDNCSLTPSGIVPEPSDTRFSYLTHIVNEYNTTNNYIDDSTAINFYLTDESSDDDTTINLYNINLYDEETMVFTEPVSGQQYQSIGWTYDYNDSSYDITLESGTFTLNDTDITEVIVAYMDDYAAITYLDASGNAVHTVNYSYVAVAQSECTLNGHTNTVETIKEPTCIADGERKYTCSVCGNEEIETIPALGHIWKYSILYEPEDGKNGMGIYECETCGTQYTEVIEAGGDGYVDLDPDDDSENDYIIKFEDDTGTEQETSIRSILAKFNFLHDIHDIGATMLALVEADAAAAYTDDGTSSGAPSIKVNLGAAESNYGYSYGGEVEVLDLSWYAPYKERVDNIVSGFLWLLFLWGLFKAAPSILGSVGITSNRLEDFSAGRKGGNK